MRRSSGGAHISPLTDHHLLDSLSGAASAAAYQLPTPYEHKPIEDWTVHDVQVWIRSMGGCYDRYCPHFK